MTILFFELIQIAIGYKTEFSRTPTEEEWRELFVLAKRQTLIGVAYVAMERLPEQQRPQRQILLQWFAAAENIKKTNERLNRKAAEISRRFRDDGFRNVILKGQGIAKYYKRAQLDKYRMPGDVDIWLDGSRKDIVDYVRGFMPDCKVVYHHVDFPDIDGVEVEIHFTPSWMNCYLTNLRLQRFFDMNRGGTFGDCSDCDDIPTPSAAFNRVYILVHIYRHLFGEGVGLRQVMDYYFVLCQGFTEEERNETMGILKSLKMKRFASAVMWVLKEVFCMEDRFLLIEPDKKEGRFLLDEIMKAGNFGHYDTRIKRIKNESELSMFTGRVVRNIRFWGQYPSEVAWCPIFKIWHYIWRKRWRLC